MMKDSKVIKAKNVLMRHFETERGEPAKAVYYIRQLQVLYENDFFEWVVVNALNEMAKEGSITVLDRNSVPELGKLEKVPNIRFYVNTKTVETEQGLERARMRAVRTAKMVNRYSNVKKIKMIGMHLEILVEAQLRFSGFEIVGRHTCKYGGKKWTKTNHNLDFIAKKKGKNLVIGVEVKNTIGIIRSDEIDVKVDICAHLGIVPVFAARWIKPYINCVRRQNGFYWMFKTQMFPLGHEKFVKDLYTRLSETDKFDSRGHKLEFPISVRTSLPPKSVGVFERWVSKVEDNPPSVDTTSRCMKRKRLKTSRA